MENTTIENRIYNILKENPETRYDDMLLFLEYYKKNCVTPIENLSFEIVLKNYKDLGVPCFGTIHRARQRIQSLIPAVSRKDDKDFKPEIIIGVDFIREV